MQYASLYIPLMTTAELCLFFNGESILCCADVLKLYYKVKFRVIFRDSIIKLLKPLDILHFVFCSQDHAVVIQR